ncbi:MAG: HNH endonuclease [Deltaproteobacteria bacterium]|nr:HNH endonuclease [Kofleriaceae bacterium]
MLDRALDALLAKLEKEKFGKTSRPREAKARAADADPRYVPNEVRRAVSERDGEQCAFVSDEGVRCNERGFLELDHRTMVCRGGTPTAEGMRWLCGPHNQFEAERLLGKELMRAKREQARARRGSAEEPACVDAALPGGAAREADVGHAPAAIELDRTEPAAVDLDREVTLAMRSMGFGAGETRRAMDDSANLEASTFEARLRAALAAWRLMRGSRCSEGPFDEAARQLAMRLDCNATWEAAFGVA